MAKKIIFLFLALALPGLIFVFLKRFGKNEFNIPIYYAQRADSLNAVCGTHFQDPYTVPDSVLNKLNWKPVKATVWFFGNGKQTIEANRLFNEFDVHDFSLRAEMGINGGHVAELPRWQSCAFFVTEKKPIILMDEQKRIRGYYGSDSLDEMDRLIVEMKILLKQF